MSLKTQSASSYCAALSLIFFKLHAVDRLSPEAYFLSTLILLTWVIWWVPNNASKW